MMKPPLSSLQGRITPLIILLIGLILAEQPIASACLHNTHPDRALIKTKFKDAALTFYSGRVFRNLVFFKRECDKKLVFYCC